MQQIPRVCQQHRERALVVEERHAEREGRPVDWLAVSISARQIAAAESPPMNHKEPR